MVMDKVLNTLALQAEIDRLESIQDDPECSMTDSEKWALVSLLDIRDRVNEYNPDWQYGVELVPVDMFDDYAREYLLDIDKKAIDTLSVYIVIDWDASIANFRENYEEVEYRGRKYLFQVY
jgi:hypothetical protein